ncbi:MAG TPA: prephenate dehydratase domain-containing protein [Candidatus Baltobacteraceae bacterium]|nr:prephenate dehydratase domain-containing protein [Candidatus Baltobacteraceae bacterium]
MIVGYQGESGAFSEEAIPELFGAVDTRGYPTFDALIEAVDGGEIPYGLLPCENSIHGPIARAYDLLDAYPAVNVVDETVHRVVQALIGTAQARVEQIRRVESHPVALEQCRRFLASLRDVEVAPVADTAGAVRDVVRAGDPARAAIGPAASAARYGGQILAHAIQDEVENYTRFFVVARGGEPRRRLGRAVLGFRLAHRPGSLHAALGIFAERELNLRALVARPFPGRPFEYVFYAELDCPEPALAQAILTEIGGRTRLLGWY